MSVSEVTQGGSMTLFDALCEYKVLYQSYLLNNLSEEAYIEKVSPYLEFINSKYKQLGMENRVELRLKAELEKLLYANA